MHITVYLGASAGNNPAVAHAVRELGAWIGSAGHTLVYGGSRSGLMGQLAQAALAAGAPVIGVEPQFFIDAEYQLEGLTQLIVTKDMAERKDKMMELGEAFIAFPGGTGTLEEIADAVSASALAKLEGPCILFNFDGYYDPVRELLERMVDVGFSTPERLAHVHFASTMQEVQSLLNSDSRC